MHFLENFAEMTEILSRILGLGEYGNKFYYFRYFDQRPWSTNEWMWYLTFTLVKLWKHKI